MSSKPRVLQLKIVWVDDSIWKLKTTDNVTFQKIKTCFAEAKNISTQNLRFLFQDSIKLFDHEIPREHGMNDGDCILAYIQENEDRKMFKCSVTRCNEAFATDHERKQHYRRHFKEDKKAGKEIKCEKCWRLFAKPHHLNLHMKSHK